MVATILLGFFFIQIITDAESVGNSSLVGKISVALGQIEDSYVSGELIFVDVSVRNISETEVTIRGIGDGRGMRVFVADDKGNEVRSGLMINEVDGGSFVALAPNEIYVDQVSLEHYRNSTESTGTVGNLLPGPYQIRVELRGVESETKTLEVIRREGIDEIVHDELNRLRGMRDYPLRIREYETLIEQYPSSNLTPNVYAALLGILFYSDPWGTAPKQIEIAMEFIDKFPDSGASRLALLHLRAAEERIRGIGKKQKPNDTQKREITKVLRDIAARYPGQRVSRFVEKEIRSSNREWEER